ncbi:Ltp family lipoprotein [Microbacterium sp. M3]|uniref:Ltp family lipoprotein n=1 Tax=Microbacterium arthrosphaerae TaxID=792652 RepID=A0ABU4GYE7_9MICO|nr:MULTISPECIES: Ltp family lipoprotein [Microbacterium]MDW4572113.1 Ltp family lipoprotein [Microbacterium arthrosphaerae]MDW7605968.1 Ltp family lipoprotein [Microbacterium sp. M3]
MSDNNINADSAAQPQLPPRGWYPDPGDATVRRFWDGARWTEHTAVSNPGAAAEGGNGPVMAAPVGAAAGGAASAGGAAVATGKRGLAALKWWQWVLIAFGALVLLSVIVTAVNGGRGVGADASADRPAAVEEAEEAAPAAEPEPVDDREEVPGLVGATVADARAALEAAGFVLAVPAGTGDDWLVLTQTLSEGRKADAGTEVFVTAEAPKPVYTLAQQNAIGKAQSYLRFSGFSRTGLIDQLEYEGYSTEEATFGADNAGADWNAEAAEKAASYLEFSSFSRQGLYDQMAYEGFTDAEIQFALAAVGY